MVNPDDTMDKFYKELDALFAAVPQSEKLFVLKDFNARVGKDHQTWDGIIGKPDIGKCNSNGLLLLKTLSSPIPHSAYLPVIRHHRCTSASSISMSLTTPSPGSAIGMTSERPRLCVVPTAGLTTDS